MKERLVNKTQDRLISDSSGQRTDEVWPCYSQEEADAVSRVLLSNRVNYWTGEEGKLFEQEFAQSFGSNHSIAMSNGTVVLEAALRVLGIKEKDEVIVTSRTFIASISCIVAVGAKPVFADVDRDSQNITAKTIEDVITPRTKAIICVHLAGWPCEMDEINELAEVHKLKVIEDCAQAHGALYKENSVGSLSDIGCWSFCQDKIMTTGGEGGMVTTDSSELWSGMWSMKDHGKSWSAVHSDHAPGFRWLHESFGTNWRMTEMQAAIGRIQLRRMKEWSSKRSAIANAIWKYTASCNGLRTPQIPDHIYHAAYRCYVFIEPIALKSSWTRDRIISELDSRGIKAFSGTCSEVYLERAFDGTQFRPKRPLPVARELGSTSIMFLVHPTLSPNSVDQLCEGLSEIMQQAVA